MVRYWADANVFIEAHRRENPVKMAVGFWAWMSEQVEKGVIVCPRRVYQEIAEQEDHRDELALWFQARREKGLCLPPNKAVQKQVGEVNTYVFTNFRNPHFNDFAQGADSWVIAHAIVDKGIVVTQESSLRPLASKPRIPDVCKHFNVPFMSRLQMFRKLDAKY
jgi:hypothetical protein